MSPLMLELPMTPLHLLPSAVRVPRSSSTLAVTALLPSLMMRRMPTAMSGPTDRQGVATGEFCLLRADRPL